MCFINMDNNYSFSNSRIWFDTSMMDIVYNSKQANIAPEDSFQELFQML